MRARRTLLGQSVRGPSLMVCRLKLEHTVPEGGTAFLAIRLLSIHLRLCD